MRSTDKTQLLIEVEKVIAGAQHSDKLLHMLKFMIDAHIKSFGYRFEDAAGCKEYALHVVKKNVRYFAGNGEPFNYLMLVIKDAVRDWRGYENILEYRNER